MSALALESRVAVSSGKHVTFVLGREVYGIPVLKVREIISWTEPTPVPRMPEFIKGIVNLRGKIIPVVDLRVKFALTKFETTARSCIIVAELGVTASQKVSMGLVVDAVEEVTMISEKDVEPAPDFGAALDTEFILGIAKLKGRVVTLLDIEGIVSADKVRAVATAN